MKVFIVNGQGGTGKALVNEDYIPIPYGEKKVKDVKVGDYLLDREGNPTKVLGVFPQGMQDVFEITFSDGRKIECSGEHLWNVHKNSWHRISSKNKFVPIKTKDILEEGVKLKGKQGYRFSIQNNEKIFYPEKKFSIHPYVIGAFLGDGCCTEKQLSFSSNDEIIVKKISELIDAGYKKRDENSYTWYFKLKEPIKNKKFFQTEEFFKKYTSEICTYSYNKKIPIEYKYGSIEQRFELLRGLFDTDGSISKNGNIRFTSTSINLIKDVQEVLHSLGFNSSFHIDSRKFKYTNNICYNLNVIIDNKSKANLFFLPRKKEMALKLPKSKFNYNRIKIISIKKKDIKKEMTCFLVDNAEHLFLAKDFLVTHNTTFENLVQEACMMKHFHLKKISMIDMVKDIATSIGWDGGKDMRDRLFLSRLKDLLAEYNDSPYQVIKSRILMEQEIGTKVLFIDARERSDIERLVKNFNATTILVKRGEPTRYGNHADDDVFNYNYDIIIDNVSTLEDLKEKAVIFTNKYIME